MNGLELARYYYETAGKQALERQVPDLVPRLAIGLAGEGSECFGLDDELSRDHDWGPGVLHLDDGGGFRQTWRTGTGGVSRSAGCRCRIFREKERHHEQRARGLPMHRGLVSPVYRICTRAGDIGTVETDTGVLFGNGDKRRNLCRSARCLYEHSTKAACVLSGGYSHQENCGACGNHGAGGTV